MKNSVGNRKPFKRCKKLRRPFWSICLKIRTSVLSMRSGLLLWPKTYSLRGEFEVYGVGLVENRLLGLFDIGMIAYALDGQAF
jgi:hypothetical protein